MSVSPYVLKTPADILKAALAREKESCKFYEQALKCTVSDESVRDLLTQLKDAEYKHIKIVEEMIAKIQFE